MPSAFNSSGIARNTQITVNQTAHGFSVSELIRSSGTNGEYTLAEASSAANAEVIGIVAYVLDVDNFVVVFAGSVSGITLPMGAVAGDSLFLDDTTPGLLTLTEPLTPGTVSKPVATVVDASAGEIVFINYRGVVN